MRAFGGLLAVIFFAVSMVSPAAIHAQSGTPQYSEEYSGELGPNRSAGLNITVTNTTDTPITVGGVTMTDLIAPAQCPRHWFGDAG